MTVLKTKQIETEISFLQNTKGRQKHVFLRLYSKEIKLTEAKEQWLCIGTSMENWANITWTSNFSF